MMDIAVPEMRPMNEPTIHKIISAALVVFVVAAAIPFVPGAEIGFAMLLLFGGTAAPVVYVAMVLALILSYSVARLVPVSVIARALRWMGLTRAALLAESQGALPPSQKWQLLDQRFRSPLAKKLLRNHYVLLAALINLPGNSLIGGGGGIAFICGLSRLFAFWPFVAVVLIAVLPIPLFFLISSGAG